MISSAVKTLPESKHIILEGRIDMSNADACKEMIVQNLGDIKKLIIDLSGLTFIDSTGVAGIVSSIKVIKAKNIDVELANVPEGIDAILHIIGVYDVLNKTNI